MAATIRKFVAMLRGPRGQAILERARRQAADPANRRRLQQLLDRWAGRRRMR